MISKIRTTFVTLLLLVGSASAKSISTISSPVSLVPRGGNDVPMKRRKRSKGGKASSSRIRSSNAEISKSMDDPAKMMGDAIRQRASELLEDDVTQQRAKNDGEKSIFASLSYAIGTSEEHQIDEGGGVEPPANAVIANYFLKSHGGAHGVQSLASLFAVLFGAGTYFTPSNNLDLKLRLMQRTLICGFAKHFSGFLGAATMSANNIPDIGWKQTRLRIEALALDPVAQYLFYCALLIVWSNGAVPSLPKTAKVTKGAAVAASKELFTKFPWWVKEDKWRPLCMTCILMPILVREIVSTLWVISDVLVLYHASKSSTDSSSPTILKGGKSVLDAIMSILLTPKVWRNANAVERQKLLAKLVGKISIAFEVGTSALLIYDAMRAFLDFSIAPVSERPNILVVAKRILCARLMVNFLLVRKKKVIQLVTEIRGGALHLPSRVLDCLLEPSKAIGLDDEDHDVGKKKTFSNLASVAFGF